MKKKRIFAFRSALDSRYLLARIQKEAEQANLKMEQTENAFRLRIDAHHGGQVFYDACISADEQGGSLIEGKIITLPWKEDQRKTKFEKVMGTFGYILGGIVFSPLLVLLCLVFAVRQLFILFKNKGERELPREEKNLLDFMRNELDCTQIKE